MTSFSSLISSIKDHPQSPRSHPKAVDSDKSTTRPASGCAPSSRFQLTASNAAAGIKRKAETLNTATSQRQNAPLQPVNRSSQQNDRSRLDPQSKANEKLGLSLGNGSRSSRPSSSSLSTGRTAGSGPRPGNNLDSVPSISTTRPATTVASSTQTPQNKKGFASILEKAKAAQAASQAVTGGIKHKPIERLTKRERMRRLEEVKEQREHEKRLARSQRSNKKVGVENSKELPVKKTTTDLSYKGTMKPVLEPAYKGTMRRDGAGSVKDKPKAKGQAQDKYGGYASWSDLDDAEDGDSGDGYDSDQSEDMEGGFDDLEHEEEIALKAARQEDQAALEEETRLRKEKLERKRRLEQMNKAAAGRRRY